MEKEKVVLYPERISFKRKRIRLLDGEKGRYQIPYEELVLACLRVTDQESGSSYEPEVTDITEEMEGELVLYDCRRRSVHLRTERLGRKAGSLFSELLEHAPYLLAGGSFWLDREDEEGMAEAYRMVTVMKECM